MWTWIKTVIIDSLNIISHQHVIAHKARVNLQFMQHCILSCAPKKKWIQCTLKAKYRINYLDYIMGCQKRLKQHKIMLSSIRGNVRFNKIIKVHFLAKLAIFGKFRSFALQSKGVNPSNPGTYTFSFDLKNFPILYSTILHQWCINNLIFGGLDRYLYGRGPRFSLTHSGDDLFDL